MGRLFQPVLSVPLSRSQIEQRVSLEGFLTGILADLGPRSVAENGCGVTDSVPETMCCATLRPWIHVLDMGRFKPREISVKVTDTKVCVHARHEDNDGENMDLIERRRTVKIPKYVNAKKIVCFLNRCGKFIIQAPFDVQDHCKPKDGKSNETENAEVPQMHTESSTENLPSVQQWNTGDMKLEYSEKMNSTEKDQMQQELVKEENDDVPTKAVETKEGLAERSTEKEIEISVKNCDKSPTSSMDETKFFRDGSLSPVPSGEPVVLEESKHDFISTCGKPVNTQRHVLEPLTDSVQVFEGDGQKYFDVNVNLNHFQIDNVRVKCQDDTLCIGAIREYEDSGFRGYQEFLRQYQLPKHVSIDEARAFITEDGMLNVKVPIIEDYATDTSGQM